MNMDWWNDGDYRRSSLEACQAILSGEAKDENQNKQAEEGEV